MIATQGYEYTPNRPDLQQNLVFFFSPSQVVAGRVGFAIDGVELRRDETGEILARGPNIFAGYWRNPQATARMLSNGWLRTGDHGDVDAHGNWRIDGRVDSLIVRPNGHKVAPERSLVRRVMTRII